MIFSKTHSKRRAAILAAAALLGVNGALAPEPIEAASAISVEENNVPEPKASVEIQTPAEIQQQTASAPQQEAKLHVESISFTGIEGIISQQELENQLPGLIGSDASLNDLEGKAKDLTRYLRDKGYVVATAYIPPQDFEYGHVNFAVEPGRYDEVIMENNTDVHDSALQRELGHYIKSGEVILKSRLERAVFLLNDLADVEAKSILKAGSKTGTSTLVLKINPKNRPVWGYIGLDNGGYKNTGRYRWSNMDNFANPFREGDLFSASILYTGHGQTGFSFTYSSPFRVQGERWGISYARSQYDIGGAFAGMGITGNADTLSLSWQKNLVRSRHESHYVGIRYDKKWLRDDFDQFGWEGRKSSGAFVLDAHGEWTDSWENGATNTYNISYSFGGMSHGDDVTRAMADFGTMAHAGRFSKWNLHYTRNQKLADRLGLFLSWDQQWTANPLDSSEKMSIAGPFAVRAYPVGEASGDRAWLGTAELRWTLPQSEHDKDNWQLIAFVDGGRAENLLGGKSGRELYGWGVGINWNNENNWMARLHYARKFNGDRCTAETDRSGRIWFQLYKFF